MIILSIESSCDETSAAITKDGKFVLSNIIYSQISIHKEYGGVVPEIASRTHVRDINNVIDLAISKANISKSEIDLVAVTVGPGLIGSLLVGINAAKAFAFANKIKLVEVNHMHGHIYSPFIENDVSFPNLSVVVSGGHTMLIYAKSHYDFEVIGQTLDDAIGESYDKVARVLGLPYPGGPIIDKLAKDGKDVYNLPRVYLEKDGFDFSYSGIKSAVINKVHNMSQKGEKVNSNDMACSFQEAIYDVLMHKIKNAVSKYGVNTVCISGGVSANSRLKERLNNEIKNVNICIPSMEYCTDNAAMIGIAAYYKYKIDGNISNMMLNGIPNLKINKWKIKSYVIISNKYFGTTNSIKYCDIVYLR